MTRMRLCADNAALGTDSGGDDEAEPVGTDSECDGGEVVDIEVASN